MYNQLQALNNHPKTGRRSHTHSSVTIEIVSRKHPKRVTRSSADSSDLAFHESQGSRPFVSMLGVVGAQDGIVRTNAYALRGVKELYTTNRHLWWHADRSSIILGRHQLCRYTRTLRRSPLTFRLSNSFAFSRKSYIEPLCMLRYSHVTLSSIRPPQSSHHLIPPGKYSRKTILPSVVAETRINHAAVGNCPPTLPNNTCTTRQRPCSPLRSS